jgi:cell division protein FtsB
VPRPGVLCQFSTFFLALLGIEMQQRELRKAQDAVAEERERRRKQQQSLSVLTSEIEQVKTAIAKLRSGAYGLRHFTFITHNAPQNMQQNKGYSTNRCRVLPQN